MNKIKKCKYCRVSFESTWKTQIFCTPKCNTTRKNKLKSLRWKPQERHCKNCGKMFFTTKEGKALQHCGDECARISARKSRTKYAKIPANIIKKRENERKKQIGNKERLYNRYPDLPKHCQSCGEKRVLDIAHKPAFKRNGAWRSAKNCTPEKIWILCPTCHALIDRMKYDPKTLGLC